MPAPIDVVRGIYEDFAAGRFNTSAQHLDPACVLVIDVSIPDAGAYFGTDGVRAYMAGFLEPWESLTIAATALHAVGDTVLAEVTQSGTGAGSQAATTFSYVQLWTFRGEKVVHMEVTADAERARRSVGL